MSFTNKYGFIDRNLFKKVFIFDIDPIVFYQRNKDLEFLIESMRAVSRYQNILLVGKCWIQLLNSIRQFINPNGQISLIAGSGSCYYSSRTGKYSFFDFMDQNSVEFITHLCTSTTSGIMVQGVDERWNNYKDLKDIKTETYFLNLFSAKEFANKWKLKIDFGYDYLTFRNNISKMKVSEIYCLENDLLIPISSSLSIDEAFSQRTLPLDPTLVKMENVSEFERNVFGFSSTRNNVYSRVIHFLQENNIELKDTYYISINNFDQDCVNNLPNLILPSEVAANANVKPLHVFDKKALYSLGTFLFEQNNIWRTIEI